MKLPSLCYLTLSYCNSLMGKWHLNPLCPPESQWPEAAEAEGRKPVALPWCWECRRDLVAGSKRQSHTPGSKKLEYIVQSCPGRSRICQEAKSHNKSLDPLLHTSHVTPAIEFSLEGCSAFWVGNPKHARAAGSIYSGIQGHPVAHKRAGCFFTLKHFL